MPIGHARDITLRALDTLATVDVIACEDTRLTGPFLRRYGVATRLVSYHEHNAERMRPALLARLGRGAAVALVSDAGMPLVSDPGYKLVRAAIDAGAAVTCLPGASAPLAALVVSGLPTDRFLMAGFLPAKPAQRRSRIAEIASVPATSIFLESAGRLAEALAALAAGLGDRPAAVARELTKRFEEVRRGTLDALARHYAAAGPPKGEIVIVVGPPSDAAPGLDDAAVDAALADALRAGASLRDAVAAVAAASGRPRREVYRRGLALTADAAGDDG